MLNSIKLYVIGIGVAVLAVFYAIIKYQSGKIETLEKKSDIYDKLTDNRLKQESDEKEVLINEDEKVRVELSKTRAKSKLARARKL